MESEPWVKIDENEANMTSQSKENDEAKDEQVCFIRSKKKFLQLICVLLVTLNIIHNLN